MWRITKLTKICGSGNPPSDHRHIKNCIKMMTFYVSSTTKQPFLYLKTFIYHCLYPVSFLIAKRHTISLSQSELWIPVLMRKSLLILEIASGSSPNHSQPPLWSIFLDRGYSKVKNQYNYVFVLPTLVCVRSWTRCSIHCICVFI